MINASCGSGGPTYWLDYLKYYSAATITKESTTFTTATDTTLSASASVHSVEIKTGIPVAGVAAPVASCFVVLLAAVAVLWYARRERRLNSVSREVEGEKNDPS